MSMGRRVASRASRTGRVSVLACDQTVPRDLEDTDWPHHNVQQHVSALSVRCQVVGATMSSCLALLVE